MMIIIIIIIIFFHRDYVFIASGAERGKEIASYIVIAIAARKPKYYILCSTQLVASILQGRVNKNIIHLFLRRDG
jgi:hypothetical protein